MKTISMLLKKDLATSLAINVVPHELRLLKFIHGKENFYEVESKSANDGLAPGEVDLDPKNEFKRLSEKYGIDQVFKCFGEDAENVIESLAEKAASEPKTAKADKTTKADEAK